MNTKANKTDGVQGEGNYGAAREYNKATRDFVESGKVEGAADAAAPQNEQERQKLEQAEAEGKSRIAGKERSDVPGAGAKM